MGFYWLISSLFNFSLSIWKNALDYVLLYIFIYIVCVLISYLCIRLELLHWMLTVTTNNRVLLIFNMLMMHMMVFWWNFSSEKITILKLPVLFSSNSVHCSFFCSVRYHLDEDPKTLKVFSIPLHDAKGSTLHYDHFRISPDGKILAATSGSILQWLCAETGKVLDTADKSHEGLTSSLSMLLCISSLFTIDFHETMSL